MLEKNAIYFFKQLFENLSTASGPQLKAMANALVQADVNLIELFPLLKADKKTAHHFLWLISDIGLLDKTYLFGYLPELLQYIKTCNQTYHASMSNWWRIAGVPEENEGEAIDLMFQWVLSIEVNPTIKMRAFEVLARLCKKYPDIRNELVLCLREQEGKYTVDFKKRVGKLLAVI